MAEIDKTQVRVAMNLNSRKGLVRVAWLVCLVILTSCLDLHATELTDRNGTAKDAASIMSTLQAPTVSLVALPDSIRVGGYSVLIITLTNPNLDIFSGEIDGLQFTISYPAPLHIATATNAPQTLLDNTCGTLAFPPPNQPQTSFSLTDGAIAAGSSCVVALTVIGTSVGASTIHTGPVTSTNADPGTDATASLTVVTGALLSAPTVQTALSPSIISSGGTSQMTIKLTNADVNNDVIGTSITEFIYPLNIQNTQSGALVRNTCGGLLSLRAGNPDYDFRLLGATIPAAGTCEVIVNVVGLDPQSTCLADTCTGQTFTGPVVSGNAQWGNSASAMITVRSDPLLSPPTATEAFVPSVVAVGAPSKMTVHLANANGSPIVGAQFTDPYPTGIANVANGVVDSNTCGGTLTADANDDYAALANGTIPAGGSCDVVLNVVGVAPGVWVNQTGPIASGNALTANTTFAGLNVDAGASPDLTLTKSHTGFFVRGQTGATYTLLAHNAGNLATSGVVAVADTLPPGLSVETMGGTGWICTLATATCSRNDTLAIGAAYPPITLKVGVASNAPPSVTNTATVSGGGEANLSNDSASDLTAITAPSPPATLSIVSGNSQSAVVSTAFAQPLVVKVTDIAHNPAPGVAVTFTAPANGPSASCSPAALTDGAGQTQTTCTANGSTGSYAVSASIDDPLVDISPVDFTLTNAAVAAPDLVLSKSHAGNFTKGQTGAVYSLIVNNAGSSPSVGTVTVTDALPAQMTLAGMSGPGWMCSLASKTCTRSDALASGANYPAITLTVDVAANAPSSLTNTANVSGGGEANAANDAASDATTIDAASAGPDVTLTKSHAGNFSQGQFGAVYSLVAHNIGGGSTSGAVTVADTLPASLTATAISGPGWICSLATTSCTRSDALAAGASYPAVTLTVDVAVDAPALVVNTASAAGGGETNANNGTANDPTTIDPASDGPDLTLTKSHAGNFSQGQTGATYTLVAHNVGGAPTAGMVTVADTLPASIVATAMDGPGWTCDLGSVSCRRIDPLQAGSSYPSISLTVDIAADAPSIVVNAATVSGDEKNTNDNLASDATSVDAASAAADLTLTKSHVGNFSRGQSGGQYTLVAHNTGAAATNGAVTVADVLPTALTPIAMGGQGWTCSIVSTTCTRSDSLAQASDYPPIALTVDVAPNAPPSVINMATISGGGEANSNNNTASDLTTIGTDSLPQAITFTSSSPSGAVVAGPGYLATATASSGLPVATTIDAASATVCTITSGNVSFIGAGTCTINANQGGDDVFAPAPQKQQSFAVMSAGGDTAQTISFTSTIPANATVGGATYLATAMATSNLPVVLTIEASSATVCQINAGTVTFIGAGTCTIDANQGGNSTYAAAPEVQQPFAVAPGGGVTPQAITFTSNAPANAHVAGTSYFATAIADSGLPTVLTIANASATVCTISNGWVSFIGAGTCTINANQGGNAFFAPAPQVQQPFAVAPAAGVATQTITFTSTAPTDATVGGASYLATATATSQLPVVLTIDASSSAICTINYGTVLFTSAGTCKVDANQGGDDTYAPAAQVQQLIAVGIGGGNGNHAPVAVDDAIQVTRGGTSNALIGDAATPSKVLDNDIDPDGDPLNASKLSDPVHGDLTFNADGTFSYQNHQNDLATSDAFTYVACDTHAACAVGIVTITIGNGLNDHVPFATDDAIQVAPGASGSDLVGDLNAIDSVLDNDIDLDGDTLTASKLTDPNHGDLTFNADGTFAYHNDSNDAAPTDTFSYEACDDFGACGLGVVSITIGNDPQDHSPIVVDDAIQVAKGQTAQTLIGDPNNPGSVLDNDFDLDAGDTLMAAKVGPLFNQSGDITLNSDGTFTYHNLDQQATTDRFVYEACDTFHACTPGIVSISINDDPPDVAPVAADDAIVVAPHGSTGTLVGGATNVLTNDTDPGDTLTAHLISAPTNGHVTLGSDGTFTYFNDDPASGIDSWMYEACDSYGACDAATVSVTVSGAAPTVTCLLPNQVNSVGDTVSIDLSLLFAPPPGQTLSYSATNAPPSLSVAGSLLSGTLQATDVPPSPPYAYPASLIATTGGASASENVTFQVLPTGEILLRDGFDGGQAVQQPCQ